MVLWPWAFWLAFWWLSRQNVGSKPGHDHGTCVLEQDTNTILASYHPGVNMGPCQGKDRCCLTLLLLRHFSRKLLLRTKPVNCLLWLLTQMCTQGHFWLVFTIILTILNNTRQCFYQSKMVESFWPVNVLTTHKVWQCWHLSALDIPWEVYQRFDWFWPLY